MFDEILYELLNSKLSNKKIVDLALLLTTQSACKAMRGRSLEELEKFCNSNNIAEVWAESTVPRQKFWADVNQKPVTPTLSIMVSYLADYLDMDVTAAIKSGC